MGWEGIGTAIGVVFDWFSPAQKKARIRNEIVKLERERSEIIIRKQDEKLANRLLIIHKRLSTLERMLQNLA